MKRLFVGLTLLLMSFLLALDNLGRLHHMLARAGMYPWVPELVLAALAVAVFLRLSRLRRRLLFPRRGMRLLTVGIAVYAVGMAAATGLLATGVAMIPIEQGSVWSGLPDLAAGLSPQMVLVAAQLLLVLGAFRALANLVPPTEFAEDF